MPAPFRPISASRSRGGSANETSAKTMFAPKLWVRPDACRVATPVACRFGARVDHHSSLRGRGSGALAPDLRARRSPRRRSSVDGLGVATSATIRLIGGRWHPAADRASLVAATAAPLAPARAARRGRAWACRPYAISIGIDAGTASLGALILGLEPICIALFGALLVRDRPSRTDHRRARARARRRGRRLRASLTVGISGTPLVAVLALGITTISFSLYAVRLPGLTRLVGGVPAAAGDDDRGRPRDPAARARRARARNRGA